MLPAQVEYWKLVENRRHNLVSEDLSLRGLGETTRHNFATEELGSRELLERHRSNVANEGIGWMNASTNRYNADTSRLNYYETGRHNLASESISGYEAETGRLNVGVRQFEALTSYDRMMNDYEIGSLNAVSSRMQAEASKQNAETKQGELELAHDQFLFDMGIGVSRELRGWTETGLNAGKQLRDTFVNEPAHAFTELVKGIGEVIPF